MKVPISAIAFTLSVLGCTTAAPLSSPWLVPAQGPALTAADIGIFTGKTCRGFFDKGINSDMARGAVFARFLPSAPRAQLWRKFGRAAQLSPHPPNPDGYENMGMTSPAGLTPANTEITLATGGGFNWYLQPIGPGTYALRIVATSDPARGAVGELHCNQDDAT